MADVDRNRLTALNAILARWRLFDFRRGAGPQFQRPALLSGFDWPPFGASGIHVSHCFRPKTHASPPSRFRSFWCDARN